MILLGLALPIFPQVTKTTGLATEIGVSSNGKVAIIGSGPCDVSGCGVYAYEEPNWTAMPGRAIRVAVDPSGNPWVINQFHEIYQWSGGQFHRVSGGATDISIGADGSIFIIGTGPCNNSGCTVYELKDSKWNPYPGSGVRLAVDPTGHPWVVNQEGEIYQWLSPRFRRVEGKATDIAIGRDASIHVVGTSPCDSTGCRVYQLSNNAWVDAALNGVNIAASSRDDVWVTNAANEIYRLGAAGAPGFQFSALNYNVMMLDTILFGNHQQNYRAGQIPAALGRQGKWDVVAFNEAFALEPQSTLKFYMLLNLYPFSSNVVDRTVDTSRSNGGVFIQSRWPVMETATIVYNDCSGFDCLANKGAAYARIEKEGRTVHVFATHLQSDRGEAERAVRVNQLKQLANFIHERTRGAADRQEPVIVLGDLNICKINDADEYGAMLKTLHTQFDNTPAGYTFDTITNTVAKYRYPNVEVKREWLDYVMASSEGYMPMSVDYSIEKPRTETQYNMPSEWDPTGLFDPGTNHYDLSDHYALSAIFKYKK